jgi:thiol-disulfide isomerase/thioredoxin
MKSKVLLGLASLSLMMAACDLQKNVAKEEAKISGTSTDDQKFAYMLGAQFGLQNFKMVPLQMGEELDEDALVQGIVDGFKLEKDTSFKLQVDQDTLRSIGFEYNSRARARMEAIRPDSATTASFNGEQAKFRAYMDSAMKAQPIVKAPAPTKKSVVLGAEATRNQKFSYFIGVQFENQFTNIGAQFQTEFDLDYFIIGVREASAKVRDTTLALTLPDDSLKAVGERYNEKMKVLREEAVKKAQEEEAKLKEAVAGLRGDTLANGMPAKMNFKVKVSGITNKAENLETWAGKPLLIFYFSATCGHCAHAAPQILDIAKEFAPKGLTTVAVASGGNNKSGIRKFADNAKFDDTINIVWDDSRQFGELYSDGYVPKVYLVNPDASYKEYVAFESEKETLKQEIAALMEGKPVVWNPEPPKPAVVDTLKPAAAAAPADKK